MKKLNIHTHSLWCYKKETGHRALLYAGIFLFFFSGHVLPSPSFLLFWKFTFLHLPSIFMISMCIRLLHLTHNYVSWIGFSCSTVCFFCFHIDNNSHHELSEIFLHDLWHESITFPHRQRKKKFLSCTLFICNHGCSLKFKAGRLQRN